MCSGACVSFSDTQSESVLARLERRFVFHFPRLVLWMWSTEREFREWDRSADCQSILDVVDTEHDFVQEVNRRLWAKSICSELEGDLRSV